MKTINVSGMSCPEPVLRAEAALKEMKVGETLLVIVDSANARDNIFRNAVQWGCGPSVGSEGDALSLILTKSQ